MIPGSELVLIPRESANDDHALLVAWAKQEGQRVVAGEKLCDLEFSKSVIELFAPREGWVFRLHQDGAEVPIGQPVAIIADTPERPDLPAAAPVEVVEAKITAKARKLMAAHGLSSSLFQGQALIKKEHVESYLAEHRKPGPERGGDEGELIPLSPIRRRAAGILTTSKQTIPHSYLSRWVPAEVVERRVTALAEQKQIMLSLFDLLVEAVAQSARRQPAVNASWREQGFFRYARVHVGFALNQANGDLLVPVLRDADRLSLDDLVAAVRVLQKKAVRQRLSPQDLSGGTITVTTLLGSGVHQVLPILVPGQAVIVALGDRCDWPAPAYCLTVAFDHRVLNGTEAGELLTAVVRHLEGEAQP